MASSALYKNCAVMYEGKMQNLAERAEHFVNICKQGGYDDSASGSTDGSGEAGSKKDRTEPVVKDEKSKAAFHSFSAACIAALCLIHFNRLFFSVIKCFLRKCVQCSPLVFL
ncbi:unnamed protein product [Albugo candida]|uniref:Uncharacterized protein n=1 Tax=Albugo candida TaxID=65357 RepID=A0A024GKS5_9STRA|nr:unnamed protein product [Albugo candida]|eukprot:CCI47334.1 unnamed protein product [Albugo candida]